MLGPPRTYGSYDQPRSVRISHHLYGNKRRERPCPIRTPLGHGVHIRTPSSAIARSSARKGSEATCGVDADGFLGCSAPPVACQPLHLWQP